MKKNEWLKPELSNLNLASTKEDASNLVTEEHCDSVENLALNPNPNTGIFIKYCRHCGQKIGEKHHKWCPYYASNKPVEMPGLDAPAVS